LAASPTWSQAEKGVLRGRDVRRLGDNVTLAEAGFQSNSVVSVTVGSAAVDEDESRLAGPSIGDLQPITHENTNSPLVLYGELVAVKLLLPAIKQSVYQSITVHMSLQSPVSKLLERVSIAMREGKHGDVNQGRLKLVVDRRMAPRAQYSDSVAVFDELYDNVQKRKLEEQLPHQDVRMKIAACCVADLVPEVGARLLVDLELALHGPLSLYCQRYWRETNYQWVPGEPALDRGVLTMLPLLYSWAKSAKTGTAFANIAAQISPPTPIAPSSEGDHMTLIVVNVTFTCRSFLVALITAVLVDISQWVELPSSLFDEPEALRQELQRRRESCRLPQTRAQLATLLNVDASQSTIPAPRIANEVTKGKQLYASLASLQLTKEQVAAARLSLGAIEESRFDRRRFMNHLADALLRGPDHEKPGTLVALASLDEKVAIAILTSSSPDTFSVALCKHVKGVGKLTAIKVASILQMIGLLPKDSMPLLGETESAFCYTRSMAHNALCEDEQPTWLKKKGKATKRDPTLDKLNMICPTQADVAGIIDEETALWENEAQQWWDTVKVSQKQLAVHEASMKQLFICRRSRLQLESDKCELGNRGKKARAGKITKGKWSWSSPKDLKWLVGMSTDASGNIVRKSISP
jgi:hypothetical protein